MGYLMIVPATIFILLLNIYPLLRGIVMSLQDVTIFNLNKEAPFIGLGNFKELLSDKAFSGSIVFTLIYTISVVIFSYLIGLGLALLCQRKFALRGLFRSFILVPWVLPVSVAAMSWLWTFAPDGIINDFLIQYGFIEEEILFFSDTTLAKFSVIAMSVWKGFPFMALTLLAALQTVPQELYEAAQVDGANRFQLFLHITLPNIKEISITTMLLRFIWTLNSFEQVYLLTRGGPVKATEIVSIYSYMMAFSNNRLSYATTISVFMMCLLLVGLLISRITKKTGAEG